ncbi:MAG: PorV/PorQ family protein [bacterium]
MRSRKMLVWAAFAWPFLMANGLQAGGGGGNGLAFLKIGVGGRATGMSEAYVAVADEATATYWNPAGLAFVNRTQVAFTHSEWIADITNEYLAFVFPAFKGTLGFSFNSNNVGGIQRRVGPSAEPIGTIDANDIAFGLSYGRRFNDVISGGVTVKYLYEKIFVESAAGYAVDVGVTAQPFDNSLRFAFVAQNLGSMGTLLNESVDLPETIRAGVAYSLRLDAVGGDLLLAADAVKVFDTDLKGNFGAELLLRDRLAFRVGYQAGFDEKGVGGGFGVKLDRYRFNYGFTPFSSNLGDVHKFSIGLDL